LRAAAMGRPARRTGAGLPQSPVADRAVEWAGRAEVLARPEDAPAFPLHQAAGAAAMGRPLHRAAPAVCLAPGTGAGLPGCSVADGGVEWAGRAEVLARPEDAPALSVRQAARLWQAGLLVKRRQV